MIHHDDLLTASPEPATTAPLARAVLLLDLEPPMAALVGEWLQRAGHRVLSGAKAALRPEEVGLVVLELAFPRQGGSQRLQQLGEAWPGVPALVLSPTLLPGVALQGEAARRLGAAAVLPSPTTREALLAAVSRLCTG